MSALFLHGTKYHHMYDDGRLRALDPLAIYSQCKKTGLNNFGININSKLPIQSKIEFCPNNSDSKYI